MKSFCTSFVSSLLLFSPCLSFAEEVDLDVIHRIKQEAFRHSKIMDYVHLIADENGSRMSGSAGYRRAADVAVASYRDAGIESASLETWGTFGRGWDWSRVAVQMKQPQETTLSAFPADFSSATNGPVSGPVVFAPVWVLKSDAPENGDLEKLAKQIEVWKNKYRGKLGGKVLMMDHPVKFKLPERPHSYRLNDEELSKMSHSGSHGKIDPGPVPKLQWPLTAYPVDKEESSRIWEVIPFEYVTDRWKLEVEVNNRIVEYLLEEGVVAVLKTGWAEGAGVIMHSDYGSFYDGDPVPPLQWS